MKKNEEQNYWKPICDFEGYYEISISGEVRGIERMVVTPQGLRTIRGSDN